MRGKNDVDSAIILVFAIFIIMEEEAKVKMGKLYPVKASKY